jgi:hypothetical protein
VAIGQYLVSLPVRKLWQSFHRNIPLDTKNSLYFRTGKRVLWPQCLTKLTVSVLQTVHIASVCLTLCWLSLRLPLTFLPAWKYAISFNPAGLNPMRSSYGERGRGRVSVFLERELNLPVRTTLVWKLLEAHWVKIK